MLGAVLLGAFLFGYGLYAAVSCGSPYWYGYFIGGLFLLLDRGDAALNHDANLTRLFSHLWRTPIYTYLTYVAGALILDLVFGSYFGNLWVYPHFTAGERFIQVILIGYPLAFFCCAALYRVLHTLWRRLSRSCSPSYEPPALSGRRLGKIILGVTILATAAPAVYFLLYGPRHIQVIIFICGLIGMFSLSPLGLVLGQKSLLGEILQRNWAAIGALVISIPLNALAHEWPNTFAWEWRYQNMPLPSLEVLGIPVIVLTLGWSYLTIFGISANELFFQ
jgi:hypothetical protein